MLRRSASIAGLITLLVVWGVGIARLMHERLAHGHEAAHATQSFHDLSFHDHAGHAHHSHAHRDHAHGHQHGSAPEALPPCDPEPDQPAPYKPHDDCVLCAMLAGSAHAALAAPAAAPLATVLTTSARGGPVRILAVNHGLPLSSRGPPQA